MAGSRSFRLKLLIASLLWTLGLMAIASALAAALVYQHPHATRIVHNAMVSVVAFACIAVGLTQLRAGLSPFKELHKRLGGVRSGQDRRLEGDYPTEVQPLVDELNALLDDREQRVRHAMSKAGDLAHGLKTPLAILAHEAARAGAAGHRDLAATLEQQIERMRRQVDRHLAQARAAASGPHPGLRCSVLESAKGLARTLKQLHAERGTAIEIRIPAQHFAHAHREDVDEMLGNLLDNACKWARGRVVVRSLMGPGRVSIVVEDDGPGIPAGLRDAVMQRGVRADEVPAGSGFGLAIVQDLASIYEGALSLASSDMGGLQAQLDLPGVMADAIPPDPKQPRLT